MLYCEHCGAEIPEDDLVTVREPHGEEWAACPRCKHTDLTEMVQCDLCHAWNIEDELRNGICEDCLRDSINYGRFEDFGLEGAEPDEVSIFEEFVWEHVMGLEPLTRSSIQLKDVLRKGYNEVLGIGMGALRTFVLDNYADEWAEWIVDLYKKEADARAAIKAKLYGKGE